MIGAAAACFGVTTALSKFALDTLTAADLLLIELALSATLLTAAAYWRGPVITPRWRVYALLGGVEPALTYLLANLGLERTSASRGALLFSLETAFGVGAAALVAHERIGLRTGLALLGGLSGALLISTELSGGAETLTGDLLVLAAAAAAGSYGVLARLLPTRDDALTVTAVQYLSATVLVLPFVAISWTGSGSHLAHASRTVWAAAVAVSLVGSAAAFLLYNYGIAQVPASRAALLFGLMPVFGIAASVLGLHEMLTGRQIGGGLLILAGLAALARPPAQPSAAVGGTSR